jgi:hypothetical protein
VGDRTLPKVLTVLPADKPKERTVIRYSHINFDLELRDDLFSIRTLQR